MVIQYRYPFALLIYILCYAAIIHGILLNTNDAEICNLLCKQCNSSAIFSNDYCKCNFTDYNEGAKCIQRLQREIQSIDLNVLSDDLTNEERSVRSILKSRRRLRIGDADKVAQYFINGGPSAGHSHFVGTFNAAYDNADSTTNSFSGAADKNNPENEFHDVSSHISLNSPISWSTHNSPLHVVPEAANREDPAMSDTKGRFSNLDTMNSIINPNGWYDLTNPLLGSIAHPYGVYRSGLPLYHTLLRTASFPTQFLQNLFANRLSNRYPAYDIIRSAIPIQNNIPNIPFVGKSRKTADDAISFDSSTARNNMGKSIATSVLGSDSPVPFIKMPYIFDTLQQPMQYRYYSSSNPLFAYYSPLINIIHPLDGYILQPIPQSISNRLLSVPNPTSDNTNNANCEQQNNVSVTSDKTVNTDDFLGTKEFNIIINTISKEEENVENNEGNK